ncbi:MAG TPA: UDP-N-acetylmuramoyl-L-alanyl-D-glutamate--2,6-diaminopimelate ligase [Actinomycetota bacterium]|nr:UDP-N-acetylmuramoyl-L-alanyl-D-glutamate--2,6-diaminopimelate ligase [Actinomycetota bacterium]
MARTSPRRLDALVLGLPRAEVRGDGSVRVTDVVYRSGDVRPGALFFCVPGTRRDGHDFAAEAVSRGAAALAVERPLPLDVPQVVVPSVREAMGPIAAAFFGRPGDRMLVVGVTGTNGKTTTTYLLAGVFRAAGMTPGLVGTTGAWIGDQPVPFERTTPEAPDLHRVLALMAERGVGAVAMEASSHGLDQHRVDGLRFSCGVFTNLSQDHLDYHGTMEAYFAAKARLFTPELSERAAINVDVPEGRRLLRAELPTVTYGLGAEADVRAVDVETSAEGVAFRAEGVEIRSPLRGLFNVYNCLAALAASRALGIDPEVAARGIATVRGVPGRMEPIEAGQPFLVLVDYAHTPDGIENVLRAARPLVGEGGRLLIVFGAGGDRDRGKRPLMGRAATSLADLAIVTSDNPRTEDPLAIIEDILPGARAGGGAYVVEPDRRAAIRAAVREAGPGDVVVIAGKGHETGQEIAGRVIPFDDRVVAREELRAMLGEGG